MPGAMPSQFESAVMENSDAAYNLARWLVQNDQDAQDIVQEACVKAIRAYDSCRGEFRPWFLTIVRNTSLTWLANKRTGMKRTGGPELAQEVPADDDKFDPSMIAQRAADASLVRNAIEQLPENLCEVIVLREIEGMSYKEIGKITGVPIGTVMSRLARGRLQLQGILLSKHRLQDLT